MLKELKNNHHNLILEAVFEINGITFKIPFSKNCFIKRSDCRHLPHNHAHLEIFIFLEGSCQTMTPSELYTLGPGDIMILAPLEYHSWVLPNEEHNEFVAAVYYIKFEAENELINKSDPFMFKTLHSFCSTQRLHDASMFSVVVSKKINQLLNEQMVGYRSSINGLAAALIVHLLQIVAPKKATQNDDLTQKPQSREEEIEWFFLANFNKDINIDSLAGELHLCTRRVNQLLHQFFGYSFSQKLNITRIEMTKNYLLHSEYRVFEIGRLCGYKSNNYFHVLFKRFTGVTPNQYRKKMLIKKILDAEL